MKNGAMCLLNELHKWLVFFYCSFYFFIMHDIKFALELSNNCSDFNCHHLYIYVLFLSLVNPLFCILHLDRKRPLRQKLVCRRETKKTLMAKNGQASHKTLVEFTFLHLAFSFIPLRILFCSFLLQFSIISKLIFWMEGHLQQNPLFITVFIFNVKLYISLTYSKSRFMPSMKSEKKRVNK